MRYVLRHSVVAVPLLLALAACGGGGGNGGSDPASSDGVDDRQIARALDMRFKGEELIYELESGETCRVIEIAQTTTDVQRILESSENAPRSLATTPDASAGVEFGGPLGTAPSNECVTAAEADLARLSDEVS
jgi:hypothetical protein